ncbi:Fc.00g025920.m01.CDS01 [Cosmosporella sp. VM-42]
MDPLSITTGALALLGVCYKTTIELKRLRNGAIESRSVVSAMLGDILALRGVLQSIEESFDDLDSGPELTGTIGNHWWDLRVSLQEGFERVAKLERLLVNVNKDVSVLDGPRRHLRLREATEQIATYRQEIQAYKDMLHLSLQSVTVYSPVLSTIKLITIKNNTTQILEKSDDIRHNIDRLQTNLEVRFQTLEALFRGGNEQTGMRSISGLRTCVRSATAVISSASVYGEQAEEELAQPPDLYSVAGDEGGQVVMPSRPGLATAGRYPLLQIPETQSASRSTQNLNLPTDKSLERQDTGENPNNLPHSKSDQDLASVNSELSVVQSHSRSISLTKLWTRGRNLSQSNSKGDQQPNPASGIEQTTARRLKFCFVGDGACGKTSFLNMATKGTMPESLVPTVFDAFASSFTVDGLDVEVVLYDTGGQEDYDRLRPLSYPDTDVFCICFAIDSPDSLENTREKWVHEVLHFSDGSPVFLLGFKKDLREDMRTIAELLRTSQKPVTGAQGEDYCKKLGAIQYLESSSKTTENVQGTFSTMIRYSLSHIPDLKRQLKRQQRKGLRRMLPW